MSFFEELKRRNVIRVGIAYGVASWLLLQIADLVMDNIEAPAWIMHVMMLFVGLGFIVSLVIAWAYEMTPEGIKREADVVREESVTHYTAKKLNFITLGAIVLLIALLLADRFMPAGNEVAGPAQTVVATEPANDVAETDSEAFTQLARGVAVLPFANLSEDPNNAFFAGGVHEDILTNLSRIADLRVISRTSMLKIAEQGLGIQEIGQQLDVSHVLEGSVRRAGDQVRVTVQLIDASNDDHLWAIITIVNWKIFLPYKVKLLRRLQPNSKPSYHRNKPSDWPKCQRKTPGLMIFSSRPANWDEPGLV